MLQDGLGLLAEALAGSFAGFQSGPSRARFYQNVMVTVPSQRDQAGVVKSVDTDGQLLVEFGVFDASHQLDLNTGRTAMLVPTSSNSKDVIRMVCHKMQDEIQEVSYS